MNTPLETLNIMFPDWKEMKCTDWSKHGYFFQYGKDNRDFIQVGLYREPMDDDENAGTYTLEVFDGDTVIACHKIDIDVNNIKYKFKYESNLGVDDGILEFDTEEEAIETINRIMESTYEEYCNEYPTADVVWLNRLLDVGNTTEVYISGQDDYTRIIMMW